MIMMRHCSFESFISPKHSPWVPPISANSHWCTFDADSYRDSFYDFAGIPFPIPLTGAVTQRKAEYLAGRYCAHKALSALGYGSSIVGTGRHRNPLWPDGIKGSISHSRTWACALVSADPSVKGVGIDIENIVDTGTLEQSRDLVLVRDELLLLDRSELDSRMAFTLAFSMKESFFKAAYPTVKDYFDYDAITITGIDIQARTLFFRLNHNLHAWLPAGARFQASYRRLEPGTLVTLLWLPQHP